jgi:hypothetical protein
MLGCEVCTPAFEYARSCLHFHLTKQSVSQSVFALTLSPLSEQNTRMKQHSDNVTTHQNIGTGEGKVHISYRFIYLTDNKQ